GEHVISEVLISRATGNRVATIASPVYRDGAVVGVVRGAVLMDTIFQQVRGVALPAGMEAYLVDAEAKPRRRRRRWRIWTRLWPPPPWPPCCARKAAW